MQPSSCAISQATLSEQVRKLESVLGVPLFERTTRKVVPTERDEAAGATLAARFGTGVVEAPLVLEGGSVIVDGRGRLVTTEQCLLHPNRNPRLSRGQIEEGLRTYLGVSEIVCCSAGTATDASARNVVSRLPNRVAWVPATGASAPA